MESNERECPFCAEIIKAKAKLCRFCKSEVEPIAVAESAPEPVGVAEPAAATEPVAAELMPAVAPVPAVEETVAVANAVSVPPPEDQPTPPPNVQPVPPPSAQSAPAPNAQPVAPSVVLMTAPPDKTKQPPVKVMWVCLFIAWACILCPVPMSSASLAAVLVIVKIILASAFDLVSLILAIICLARSKILHGVLGLIAATLGTTIVYILGFFVIAATGMSAHMAAYSPSSRASAPPNRVVETPSQPARSGSGAGSASTANSGSTPLYQQMGTANAGSGSPSVAPPSAPSRLTLDCGNGVKLELMRIPAGTFMMGSPESEGKYKATVYDPESPDKLKEREGRYSNNEVQHTVTLSKPFYMGVYEVTQAQYHAVMGTNPSKFKNGNLPVEMVSWDDAMEFCRKLSIKTGRTVRLPTEAEWEYACRAGTTTPFYFGATISTQQANYDGNYTYGNGGKGVYRRQTTPVGSFPANAHGLYDMHGNVWEWCSDWHGDYPKGNVTDPQGPSSATYRVLRGGSWNDNQVYCHSAYRGRDQPGDRHDWLGFRVSLD